MIWSPLIINSNESDNAEYDGQEEGPDVLRSLTLLDELSKFNALDEEDITAALADVTKTLENLILKEEKQSGIQWQYNLENKPKMCYFYSN